MAIIFVDNGSFDKPKQILHSDMKRGTAWFSGLLISRRQSDWCSSADSALTRSTYSGNENFSFEKKTNRDGTHDTF